MKTNNQKSVEKKKHVALFGGAFNPPHEGHLACAKALRDFLGFAEIWLLVTPDGSYKKRKYFASFKHRLNMTEILVKGEKNLHVSDIEKQLFTGQTIDTLRGLTEKHPDTVFYWVMGEDNLRHFHEWKNHTEILENYPIIVIARKHGTDNERKEVLRRYKPYMRKNVQALTQAGVGILYMPFEPIYVQSHKIVEEIEAKKEKIKGLKPAILDYIKKNRLYGSTPSRPVAAPKTAKPD